ncbi:MULTISPECIES: ABC transporter permease [unclassified Roseburia]|uniref:ABC transporter permease n=1 Tax=unclassified Roseburia TaxID=2637578 RepID=UPI001FA8CE96|nr:MULTISPECIES: ABC transporter permease [unclassified Roseburia]
MKSMMKRNTFREIKKSFGRYFAILAIIALGVAFFSGLKITQSVMVHSADVYLKDLQFYDYRLVSTLGFTEENVEALAEKEDVRAAEGAISAEVLYKDAGENERVIKMHSITEKVNKLKLIAGEMPQSADECVVDSALFSEDAIGSKLVLSENNTTDDLDKFAYKEYTITGLVQSPCYIQFERGNTSIGNGRISGFAYILKDGFAVDYDTEIYIKFDEDYDIYSDEYDSYMDAKEADWEAYTKEQADIRYEKIVKDAQDELDEKKEELEEKRAEAEVELESAKQQLTDGETEISDGKNQIASAKTELSAKASELQSGKDALSSKAAELESASQQISGQESALAAKKAEYEQGLNAYLAAKQQVTDQRNSLEAAKAQLTENTPGYEEMLAQIEAGLTEVAGAEAELNAKNAELEAAAGQLSSAESQLAAAKQQIEDGKNALAAAEAELTDGEKQLAAAKEQIEEKEDQLEAAETELADGLLQYQENQSEFDEQMQDADDQIADAQSKIDEIEKPETYVLDRNTNVGYVCLKNDSGVVKGIANVFPVFFFLVAALICMTTMNRMVEEQRTQIGVLKALGFSEGKIMGKYLFYSGSAAISGTLIGYVLGIHFFPLVIITAYGIVYKMGGIYYVSDLPLALVSLTVAVLCSVGTTWLSCHKELKEVAADLMRPKAPKAGKRVFLEHVPFIWKRLKFLQKVSVRNIVRYKKRFFMMVIGISGCTALLVMGFGVRDSVVAVADQQYEEIQLYDIGVTLKAGKMPGEADLKSLDSALEKENAAGMYAMEKTIDLVTDKGTKSIHMVAVENPDEVGDFISLHTKKQEPIAYPKEGEAVLSKKVAETYAVKKGDTILLRDSDNNEMHLKVTGICENHIYNYVYIAPESYEKQIGDVVFKNVYVRLPDASDIHEVSAVLMKADGVTAVTVNSDMLSRISQMMSCMNYIVIIIIICAGALAFIVLYNLNNINITERVREIATIKVLGFYPKETASYVFRENMVLTAIGCGLGLILGKWFHRFVMGEIQIDMVSFNVQINAVSYLFSVLLTMGFAWIVNCMMTGKLERINMAESLKSID